MCARARRLRSQGYRFRAAPRAAGSTLSPGGHGCEPRRTDVVPVSTGTTSSATSHVRWCWDGIACEAGKPATRLAVSERTQIYPAAPAANHQRRAGPELRIDNVRA
jgi:hypothetical protein